MKKLTKKLTLNKEKLRVLTEQKLEQVNGGAARSDWCSTSLAVKCGGSDFCNSNPTICVCYAN